MCKSCPPCLWEKSWWCCCWVVCSLQCAGVLVVKVYDWQECVSRAKWAFTLSEQGGGCCVRNMCPIFLCDITGHCVHSAVTHHQHHHQHLPSGGAGRRAGAAEAGEEGWAGRGGVWEVCWCFFVFFFLSAWTKFCHVVYKITCFPSACVLMWHGCTLQELAGRVRGQRLQQQHSVHSCLLRGAVCRGHLHHHRRALWTDHQQTLHNEGEVCSSDGVALHIHWHFNAAFQYPFFYTVWYAKNIFSLSNAVCRKYKNVSSHHSLHAFLPMLTHNPLRSCGYVTSP